MLRSQSFSLLRSALSFPSLWPRIFVATFVLLAGLSFTEQAQAQCASSFVQAWRLCASGSTLTEGIASVITLSVTRGFGVAGVAAEFSVGVPSSIATGANSATVTISPSASTSTTASFIVQPANTSLYEGQRSYSLSASRTDSTEFPTIALFVGLINDDESPPSFSLSAMPTSWSESASSVSVSLTATLGSSIGKSLSVTFSAKGTSDYSVSSSQTRTISQGSTSASASLTFTPVNDDVDEPDISVTVIASSNDSGIGSATVTLTQRDDDTSEALSFSRTSVIVAEGANATYTVSLAEAPTGPVSVTLSTSGDPDITVTPASLTFTTTTWSIEQTVTVSAGQDDDLADGSTSINHLASGANYVGITGTVTATEEDDDTGSLVFPLSSVNVPEGGDATYSLSLSHQPSSTVTVAVAKKMGGDPDITVSPPSLTFTTTTWSTGQTITLAAASDTDGLNGVATIAHTASGAEYAGVTADVTATEQDSDRELVTSHTSISVPEGSSATYTVKLATQPTGTVTVSVSWLQGDSDLSISLSSLSFTTTDWSIEQTVTVFAAQDNDLADGRALFLHSTTGGGYEGVTTSVTATENDNDTAQLRFSTTSITVPEDDHATYTVRPRYAPSGTVSISVAVATGGDDDITVSPPRLTFFTTNWSTPQTVTVFARDDNDAVNGSRKIKHTAAGAEYAGLTAFVTATEQDDDEQVTSAELSLSDEEIAEGEASALVTVTATLDAVTSAGLSIALSFGGTATADDYSVGGSQTIEVEPGAQAGKTTLTFAPTDDVLVEDEETIIISGTALGLTVTSAELKLVDNDEQVTSAELSLSDEEIAEGEASALVTVTATLDAVTSAGLSIALSFGGTATADDYSVEGPRVIEIEPGEQTGETTLTFAPTDDVLVEDEETIIISGTALGLTVTSAELKLVDNDEQVTSAELSLSDEEIAEGEASPLVTVTATLDAVTSAGLSIALSFGGTATADDYSVGGSQTIEVEAGKQTGETTLTFVPIDDAFVEDEETIIISGTALGLTVTSAELKLVDNDEQVTSAELSLSDEEIAEGEASALVTVTATLDAVTSAGLSIALSFGGTATADDYSVGGSQTIEVEPGAQAGETTLTFAPTDDVLVEDEETIIISGTALGLTVTSAELKLVDNDEQVTSAELSLSDEEIAEGEASALVTVTATLDAVTSAGLSIALSFGGTATADDYSVGGSQTIEVEAGKQTGETTLTFVPIDDALVEDEETIIISGTALGLTVTSAELKLVDNDEQVTSAELSLSDEEIAEGEASALVTVTATLDAVTSAGLSIALSFGGTATADDYSVGGSQTIEVEAGKQTGETTLTFVPIDDALVEDEETIIVNGSSPGLTISQATLTLLDDDFDPGDAHAELSVDIDRIVESARDTLVTVTLTLLEGFSFDELQTFEITLRGSGAAAAVDFAPIHPLFINLLSNSSVGHTTFVLSPENDLVDELDETLTLSVAASLLPVTPTTITLADDDAPPTGISLSVDDPDISEGEEPSAILLTASVEGGTTYAQATTLTLDLGGTATEGRGGDYTLSGSLVVTILAGQALANTILTFTVIDDSRDELDETIDITATTPAGLPVTPTSLTLLDNDESLLTLRAEPRRLEEGSGPVTVILTVTIRSATPYEEDLDISLEFGGTAIPAKDYSLHGSLTFTIPAGDMSASTSIIIIPVDDTLDEPDETLEIAGNAAVGYTSTAVVLIIDNDIPPARIQLTAIPTTLSETAPATRVLLEARVEGDTAFSTDTEIALALEGTAIASVDYDVGGINDPLILPAGRLSVTRELNITPIDDPHPEGTEKIVITGMTIVRILPATIALLDDDGADLTISFSHSEYTANEYGSPATVVVTVSPPADRREVIGLTFSHLGDITPDDYRGIPNEIAFEPGDEAFSFTVEALPDQAYESGERIRLRLDSPSTKVSFQPLATATVLFVEQRPTDDFSTEARTVLALSSRAWSDSVQMALEERFARARQTEEWGNWQPDYQEPRNPKTHPGSPAFSRQRSAHADRIVPGDWLAAWRQKNERRNMGLIDPRFSLRKVLAKLKGWRPVLWAEGSTHHFSGQAQALDYQGAFQAAHVGLDLHSSKNTLIGASVMRGYSTIDYSNGQGLDGSTTATLYTVHPYLHFQAHDRITVWTAGGLGFAPLTLQELDRDHDLSGSARMAAGGVRILAKNWDRRELAIRTDTDIAWIGAHLPAESVTLGGHAGRIRFLTELTQTLRLYGQTLIATGEAGGRFDHGAAHRGAGAETAGRLSWRNPKKGLDLSAHGQTLLWQASGFRSWGAGVQASWDPGAEKRGLVVRFASGRGPRGGKTRLFQEPIDRLLQPGAALDTELELGYGTGVGSRLLTLTFRLRGVTGWTAAVDLR